MILTDFRRQAVVSVQFETSCARGCMIWPRPVRCTLQPSFSPYTPYACGTQRTLHHEYLWSTGNGSLWLWLWCCPYKLCSDLSSQPKPPGDLDLWPWKWCPSHVGYLCANFSHPRPLCSRVRPDIHDRQTSDKSIA